MKPSRTLLQLMPKKSILFLLVILLSSPKSKTQSDNFPQAGLLCISDCETCPAICSPPPSSSLPATPRSPLPPQLSPPPPVHHHSPPQAPFYFTSPSPSYSPPAHPPPSPPSGGGAGVINKPPSPPSPPQPNIPVGGAFPTPPSVYVYNPGNMGQRNFSYPYYYFYASKASCSLPALNQGFIFLVVVIFFQFLF